MKRNISGKLERPFSGDQIWEEPEMSSIDVSIPANGRASSEKLREKPQNPPSRVRFEHPEGAVGAAKPLNRFEIQHNPPSQSRNAQYTTNVTSETPAPVQEPVEKKHGIEIRSQDIRNATSMKMKDRSSKLPEPTAVSNRPGRPIVSFDANWQLPQESTDVNLGRQAPTPSRIYHSQAAFGTENQPMAIPSIIVEGEDTARVRSPPRTDVPAICVAEPDDASRERPVPTVNVPIIAVDGAPEATPLPIIITLGESQSKSSRPLPTPGAGKHPTTKMQRPRGHWSPAPGSSSRTATICHECGQPIEGRFVALAGGSERFHPGCFSCYTCGTGLEAMEISPEPAQLRDERLDRIRRRAQGELLDEAPGTTMAEDGDDRLRFFCHLDWHALFAPRCRHCKTPILGEHIVALGEHWHYGHFFCAECGDPFGHGMTHIEKDGYAWCIKCQTQRTERRAPKCKKCRMAVIGQYVQALEGEWHDHCFRCAECHSGFDDGQVFPKEVQGATIVLCTSCRTRELKS